MANDSLTITVIYDNNLFCPGLKNAWGFSCLIEGTEKKVLFDTGGDGKILLSNMKNLGIDAKEIDAVFLSHEHWDHVGGLGDFIEENQNAVIYLPSSFTRNVKENVGALGGQFVEISSPAYLCEDVASTGELGKAVKEQSLVIAAEKGLIIITGCAHPGIVHIIKTATQYFEQDVYLVIGGFHLGGCSDLELKSVMKEFRDLGVKKVGPCHCSGECCQKSFAEEYEADYLNIGVGKVIDLE